MVLAAICYHLLFSFNGKSLHRKIRICECVYLPRSLVTLCYYHRYFRHLREKAIFGNYSFLWPVRVSKRTKDKLFNFIAIVPFWCGKQASRIFDAHEWRPNYHTKKNGPVRPRKIECRSNGQHRTIDMSESGIVHSNWYSTFNGLIKIFALVVRWMRRVVKISANSQKALSQQCIAKKVLFQSYFFAERIEKMENGREKPDPKDQKTKKYWWPKVNDICLLHYSSSPSSSSSSSSN